MTALAKATVIVILLVVATIGADAMRDIPEFLHVCQVGEPEYDTCVSKSINDLKPYLKVGVPEYNIPSLEPLKLKQLSVSSTNSLKIQATDVNVAGASNFQIMKVKVDTDHLRFMVDIELPNIFVDGKYEVDGKIMLLPLRGSGPIHGNFSDCIGACKIQGERYFDENGLERIRITEFKMKISVGKGWMRLDNLFNGEEVLGNVVNTAINNNFDVFMREFLPLVEKALSDAFKDIAENIVQQFSYAQLFPGAK
ncbi:circadian clock-controlled protein [Lasius niger]|uniref:Circadian clock-controlled protein n=1 Tax=Lasius niger TaxID=67767 RepID=A0A0J7KZU9_LASNI|nr:circadian clock-controlled protein [Lasius niger]